MLATLEPIETNRFDALFDELVPPRGKASSVAGELIRAAARISHRWHQDGDRVCVAYGRWTCNGPARYLVAYGDDEEIQQCVYLLWGNQSPDSTYQELVDGLCDAVARYVDTHPELRTIWSPDMWDYRGDEDDYWG